MLRREAYAGLLKYNYHHSYVSEVATRKRGFSYIVHRDGISCERVPKVIYRDRFTMDEIQQIRAKSGDVGGAMRDWQASKRELALGLLKTMIRTRWK